jgi:hypothetical protein
MVKRNASSGSPRSAARKMEKAARPAGSAKAVAKRRAPAASKAAASPTKPAAGKVAAKPATRKAAIKKVAAGKATAGKAAVKSTALRKPAVKTPVAKKSAVAKQPVKAVKTSVRGKSAGHAKAAAGKAAAMAIMLEQVGGWTVVDVADGIAVHDSHFKGVHYLNHTAAAIYLLCKEPIGLSVVSTILREEFGLDRDPASEIERTVAEMMRIGLIRRAGKQR